VTTAAPGTGARRRPRTATTRWPSGRASSTREWGLGTIGRREGEQLTVVFDTVGYKTLAMDVVREKDLLRPAPDA
jgi:ATP-dependent DNA helicase RecQ